MSYLLENIIFFLVSYFCRNACRHQGTDNSQIETIRNRAAQYSEPSSRRGSVGVCIKYDLICK
jgi:hypothetical protein